MHGQQNIKKAENILYDNSTKHELKKPVILAVCKVVTVKNIVFSDLIP